MKNNADKIAAYQAFLESKIIRTEASGFDIADSDMHPALFPHQRDIVRWCIKGGRRAGFQSFGTGKTIEQLEICRLTAAHHGKPTLIIAPLGVKQEFQRDAIDILQMPAPIYVRNTDEIKAHMAAGSVYFITNYERVRDGGIDIDIFGTVCLDEASVLRGYGTKTYQTFLPLFKDIPYRFVFTATPSPNRYKELIHYAGFLGVMDTGQALTRFFQRNPSKAGDLTIYPHKEKEFWLWVSSWAIFLQKPSDLGYSDVGYDLPEFKVIYHPVPVDHLTGGVDKDGNVTGPVDSWGQYKMVRDAAVGLKEAAREKRDSQPGRMAKCREIIDSYPEDAHWLLWHHRENERHEIEKTIPKAKTLYGTQDLDIREELTIGFSDGKYPILATKPELSGSGCNFQRHCHLNIFIGINYEFNDFIQAIMRTQRFLQTETVEVHIIYAESEESILKALQTKWKQHDDLSAKMVEIIREYGLTENAMASMTRSIGCDRQEARGEYYTAVHNDTVVETINMEDNSVDMDITSIPFANHYEYSASYNDLGHTDNNDHFWAQMDFLTPEMYRTLRPGRIAAIHVKDRIVFGNVNGDGFPQVSPFHVEAIMHYMKHGFRYMGMITVTTDVVRENNQTYRLGWSECCKDGTKMGVGSPEYVLLFRKPPTDNGKAYADVPVTKEKANYPRRRWQIDAAADWRSSGNRLMTPEEIASLDMKRIQAWWNDYNQRQTYDYRKHIELGAELENIGRMPSSFMLFNPAVNTDWTWSDILRMRTLNAEQSKKREENHICPFQLDIIERLIERYTNPGELVRDVFAGLFSVPYVAIQMGRRGRGHELNSQYFDCGRRYCYEAEYRRNAPSLFDLIDLENSVEASLEAA